MATDKSHRINGEINAPQLRLTGVENEPLGIVSLAEAFRMAEEANVDLVEIAPTAQPPVARLMDYGKFKFQEQKKAHEAKLKQKVIQIKEVKFRPGTDEGDYLIKLRNQKRVGSEEAWDKAETALIESLKRSGFGYEMAPGEGAFYGPKIEYSLKDAIGRVWQCGTIQVDFSMPVRLGAEYVAEDNTRKVPVMVHRAILGSLERFIGMLIENHAGALPLWLAPVQVAVLNISDGQAEYAKQVTQTLQKQGFRVHADLRNEKITYKIREHSVQKIPYIVVIGDKERDANTVAVRARGNVDLGVMPVDDLVSRLKTQAETKA